MNPTQDNQNQQTNQTPEPQLPEKLNFFEGAPEYAVKPIVSEPSPSSEIKSTGIQLENETPLDLTVREEIKPVVESRPTTNPVEVPVFTPTAPMIQTDFNIEKTPSTTTSETSPSIQYDTTADYSLSSGTKNPSPDTQKIILVVAGILGALIVFGGGFYFLRSRTETNTTQTSTQQPTTETTMQPVVSTSQKLSVLEYQKQIADIESKTITTIKNAPINVNAATQNIDQIRFASDNLFANYQDLMQMNVSEDIKPLHSQMVTNYKLLVDSYDIVLKSLKETNKITPEARTAFSTNYNKAVVAIDDTISKIEALK